MKKVTLMACLFMASASFAQTGVRTIGSVESFQTKLEQRIQTPAMTQLENGAYVLDKGQKATEKPSLSAFVNKAMLSEQELHVMAEQSKIETLDSIISRFNSADLKYSKQQFEYYSDNHYPKERINSMWNGQTKKWDPVEIYNFVWDEDGYCTVQEVYAPEAEYGKRIVYTYNERKLGISQTIYIYDSTISDEWYPTEKGEYEYNDNGDIIKENMFVCVDGEWVPTFQNIAAYDDNHTMTMIEPYIWDGGKFIANGNRAEYVFDSMGNWTLLSFFCWDDETDGWLNWRRLESKYLENSDKLTQTIKRHWNKTYQNWSGMEIYDGSVYVNSIVEITYDEQKRKLRESYSECREAKENIDDCVYLCGAYSINEYSTLEGGLTKHEQTSYNCADLLSDVIGNTDRKIDYAVWHYDSAGREVYFHEDHINSALEALEDYETRETEYDNKSNVLRQYQYVFRTSSANLAVYTYDGFGNVLTQQHFKKIDNINNDEDWTNGNRFEYAWDAARGVMLDKKAFIWNGVEYTPAFGEGYEYDFDADMSKIYVWIGGDMEYKLLEQRSYTANDGEWDWIGFKYYYSEVESESGIDTNIANSGIRVYPTCVNDCLYVDANEDVNVNIYNLQGARVISTGEKAISVSDLANGIYLVEVNGYKTKIVKK